MKRILTYLILLYTISIFSACTSDTEGCTDPTATNFDPTADSDDGSCVYDDPEPTPYELVIPQQFSTLLPAPLIPADNPMTVEGVALGRKLFFDPILSGDGTQACANCHLPASGFTENNPFSVGIDGIFGNRNSMAIFNVAWNFKR